MNDVRCGYPGVAYEDEEEGEHEVPRDQELDQAESFQLAPQRTEIEV